jgi:hypothetical protein
MNLLLECAGAFPDADRICRAAAAVSDWDAVIAGAERHGVAPLLHWHIGRICPELAPAAVMARLHHLFRVSAVHSLQLTGALLDLITLFDRAGIEVLPFKGPALAWSLYETPALREMSDLDLLIRPRDRSRAILLLQSAGYAPSYPCDVRLFDPGRQIPFESPTTGVAVDLHWSLAPPQFGHALDVAGIWSRVGEARVAGRTVRTLGTEDLLIFLCVHGAKHGWCSIHWLSDLARLIRRDDIDWDRLLARATARQTSRVLYAGLMLSADLLGAPVPDPVLVQARSDAAAARIAAFVRPRFLDGHPVPPTWGQQLRFQFSLLERKQDKLRSCWWQLQPHPSDHESLPLPSLWFALYYALRPLRLAARHCVF